MAEVRRKKTIVNPQQAYRYLDRFKGIDFVDKFYNVGTRPPHGPLAPKATT